MGKRLNKITAAIRYLALACICSIFLLSSCGFDPIKYKSTFYDNDAITPHDTIFQIVNDGYYLYEIKRCERTNQIILLHYKSRRFDVVFLLRKEYWLCAIEGSKGELR